MNINFTSTYRIPITQAGINNAKKERMKQFVSTFPHSLVSNQKTGYARVSIENERDNYFESRLQSMGYKVYQKFDAENILRHEIDDYIKEALKYGEYSQKGKQPPKKSTFAIRPDFE